MNLVPKKQKQLMRLSNWVDDFLSNETDFLPLRSLRLANESVNAIEVSEDEQNVYVQAEMPGLEKKDINIEFNDGLLTIQGERQEKKENKNKTYSEFNYGKIQRTVNVGNVDDNKAIAEFSNGIITVTLPKREVEKSKKIRVE